jgi:hypothetical protein
MPIHFTCTVCQNPVSAPDEAAGRVGKCPKCGARVAVPENDRPLSHTLTTAQAIPAVDEREPNPQPQPEPPAAQPLTPAEVVAARQRRSFKIAAAVAGCFGLAVVAAVAVVVYGFLFGTLWLFEATEPERKRNRDEIKRLQDEMERSRIEFEEQERKAREAESVRRRSGTVGG